MTTRGRIGMEGETFGTAHIALTAALTGLLVLASSWWLMRREGTVSLVAVAVVSGLAVFLWRQSANMPALNEDGLEGFSANDWLAPVMVYVALGCFQAVRLPADLKAFGRTRAVATVIVLVINVVTI